MHTRPAAVKSVTMQLKNFAELISSALFKRLKTGLLDKETIFVAFPLSGTCLPFSNTPLWWWSACKPSIF